METAIRRPLAHFRDTSSRPGPWNSDDADQAEAAGYGFALRQALAGLS
jgi:hypothetical protein